VSTNAVAVPGATSDSSPLPCAAQIQGDPRAANAHVIVVWKAARRAALYRGGQLASLDARSACWDIGLAHAYPPGHKTRQGDLKTPEGWYRTSDKPWSQFDHAIAVHYPNTADARAGVAAGLIDQATATRIERAIKADRKPPQDTALGGEILLHAGGASDWTLGCVAFDDRDIARLRRALPPTMSIDLLIVP
jgi:hypothetical protein